VFSTLSKQLISEGFLSYPQLWIKLFVSYLSISLDN
jgi:hypothetical protein